MLAGIEFVAEHCRDGNARLADSRFWQTSEKINEYKKNDRFLYQDDTLLKKKKDDTLSSKVRELHISRWIHPKRTRRWLLLVNMLSLHQVSCLDVDN